MLFAGSCPPRGLRSGVSYSILLYDMPRTPRPKRRVTFRLEESLTRALRMLPNQTAFVERVLRGALAHVCPLCHGSGEVPGVHMTVSDLKGLPGQRLDRAAASQLKALVRLGRELMATDLELEACGEDEQLGFRLARKDELLLTGRIPRAGSQGTSRETRDVTLAH